MQKRSASVLIAVLLICSSARASNIALGLHAGVNADLFRTRTVAFTIGARGLVEAIGDGSAYGAGAHLGLALLRH